MTPTYLNERINNTLDINIQKAKIKEITTNEDIILQILMHYSNKRNSWIWIAQWSVNAVTV